MARFSGGFRTAGAGSTTLPIASLYAVANRTPRVFQVGVFNTTTTAVALALRRATTTGTTGAARDELFVDDPVSVAAATLVDTHTVAPTLTAGVLRVGLLGAAVGSGVIWTFSERGAEIPPGTANGLCIVPLTGTGQICDVYWEWSE